ncbi:MAG: molecular chaperone HtpG [Ruminococcaceae bacterium]|nr:molecular chaperone HtpG [Oscillospiraceae bacterium]
MNEKEKTTGGISVNTENIFPVIKKWLYSEKDIFLRELVSNATDAVTKLRRLASLGEISATDTAYRIDVTLDKDAKTLTVEDNGIGMTEEELKKYICSIALSGAVDFIQKYEGETDGAKNGIIGHFGLGFYSAFMVSDTVEIYTRSYTGAPAVHWTCSAEGEYEIEADDKESQGTEVVLHISEDEAAYLNSAKIQEMLQKYCAFMPVEIYFDDGTEKKEDAKKQPINDTTPLWQKSPADCTEEEYKDFYRKVFADFKEPLFQIHINADYPLNFKGILYFPRIASNYESLEGQVKLYYNQVFVADNIKEVIPEYLLMLKGVLDCPELPLNVSRSYLQTNSYVAKVSAHIVKKVADKLLAMNREDREAYEKVWDDIKTFVEYACMRDEKFWSRVKDALLLKLTDGTHKTIQDYLEAAKEKHENTVYYTTDPSLQAQYIAMYAAQGIQIVSFDSMLDTQFAAFAESKMSGVRFVRVDADLSSALKNDTSAADSEDLRALFRKVSENSELTVKFEALKDGEVPAILNVSEASRRMEDMMRMYRMSGGEEAMPSFPVDTTLIVNTASPLVEKISAMQKSDSEKAERFASYLYRLAVLSQRRFSAEETQEFLKDSYRILTELAQ